MAETAKPNRKLAQHEVHSAEYKRRDLIATPEVGTSLDEMLEPAYWAHVAKQLQPWDRIDVRAADGTWFAELLVVAVANQAAKVHLLQHVDLGRPAATQVELPAGYELKARGKAGWCVIRVSDKAVIVEGAGSPADARAALIAHLAKVG